MPGSLSLSRVQQLAVMVGGAAGAVVRHAATTTWSAPHQLLISTVLMAGAAFVVGGFLLTARVTSAVRAFALGASVSAASFSAYAVLTMKQTPLLSFAFLTLTPLAAVAGLVCGVSMARVAAR